MALEQLANTLTYASYSLSSSLDSSSDKTESHLCCVADESKPQTSNLAGTLKTELCGFAETLHTVVKSGSDGSADPALAVHVIPPELLGRKVFAFTASKVPLILVLPGLGEQVTGRMEKLATCG